MTKVIYKAKQTKKKTKKSAHKGPFKLRLLVLILILVLLTPAAIYQTLFFNKISPGIYINGLSVGGLSQTEASEFISQKIPLPESIKLINQSQTFTLYTKDVGTSYDYNSTAKSAFEITRAGNIFYDFLTKIRLLVQRKDLGLAVNFDNDKVSKFISVISGQDSVAVVAPSIKLVGGKIVVAKGSPGKEVDQDKLRNLIENNLSLGDAENINIPVNNVGYALTDLEVSVIKDRAEKYIGQSIGLSFEYSSFVIKDSELISFLDLKGGFIDTKIDSSLSKITSQVERDPQNPKFVFEGGKVTEFAPALDGIKVDKNQLKEKFKENLDNIENGQKAQLIDIPVARTSPEVSTDSVNNLGISELIGRGTSTYYHSIPSRVHNVVLAASRINGTLVKPGATFSFNNTLGDVSAFTGYQQAYIISEGKTILGDGGGVCQVSTTLFRALLNAGLNISDRTAHAYRVGYYEQNSPPGLDATVYGPSPDLKFVNDTPGYILIEATANPKNYSLVFELYGTSDGRVATVSKPIVSNVTPALPTVYQDDPTLPVGTLKQTDFAAKGAKITFKYLVTRNGETLIDRTFISNYKPWAAVYLRGTAP